MNNNIKADFRFYELDLLRFFAALFVVIFHYTFRGYAADNMTVLSFNIFSPFARYGYLGFHLFFIISGFVILLTAYNKTAADFVISRMVRLYPAYWFSVTFTFLTILYLGPPRYQAELMQYLINLTMIHGYIGVESIDGVYWTLMVELKFYFLIFILILFNQIKKIKYYLGIWIVLSFIFTIFDDIRYIGFFIFPEYSYYFIAGACFYLIYKEGKHPYYFFLIGLTYGLSIFYVFKSISWLETHYATEFSPVIIILFISSFYLIFFMIATKNTKLFNNKIFLSFGALTYPLYLIHQNIGYILFNHLYGYLNKYLILLIVTFFMFINAYLINIFIEKKFSKKFKKLLESSAYCISFLLFRLKGNTN